MRASHLAVGDDVQPERDLPRDRVADRLVGDAVQRRERRSLGLREQRRHVRVVRRVEPLEERLHGRRTQQAADGLAARWNAHARLGTGRHGRPS